jgi:hypothetical protein
MTDSNTTTHLGTDTPAKTSGSPSASKGKAGATATPAWPVPAERLSGWMAS